MISNILKEINDARGDDKTRVMINHKNNDLFKKVLEYTYNNYKQYFVIKVPAVDGRKSNISSEEAWNNFFSLLDDCDKHEISGNKAIELIHECFLNSSPEDEEWMRKVLQRHLNIGISTSRINKVFPNLVSEFKVQLAHKFEEKRIKGKQLVAVEPKLDGFRCLAIIKDKKCVLYSRNGKVISNNFRHTICNELEKMLLKGQIQECVLDGELMGNSFKHTTEQVHRKDDADVREIFFNVFDFIPLKDWIDQEVRITCQEAREKLEDCLFDVHCKFVKTVRREIVAPSLIKKFHDLYVSEGYEGVMIKILDDKYKFGRGYNVMKLKEFFDEDVPCVGFEEGSGKYAGTLGAILVNFNNVVVNVGSGFTDEQRDDIWRNRTQYRGLIAEVRAQEITPDGSLRFPTFRGWRHDKADQYSKED